MKKTKLMITLPFPEVSHKLNYEFQWGTLRNTVLCHDLLDSDTDLFLLENNRILHLRKQGQDTLVTVIEPQDSSLSLQLTDLFFTHLQS